MALLAFDGFDHYNNASDIRSRNNNFIQYQFGNVSLTSPGRNGFGKALNNAFLNSLNVVFKPRNSTFIVGMAVQSTFNGGGTTFELVDSVSGVTNVGVWFNPANYSVQVYRGQTPPNGAGVLLYAGPNNTWTGQVWNFVEIKPVIASGTGGSVEVHVNGTVAALITGVNTLNSGANAWADVLVLNNVGPTGVNTNYDDLYYCDTTTGPGLHPCNTFLGDVRVATLFAIGNDSVQWTPLAGTNWQEVSEVVMDSDTSYNSTSTPGNEDRYNYGTLPASISTVFGLQVTGAYRKDDASARTIKQALKTGVTEVYGSNYSLQDTTYGYFTDIWVMNPNTSLNWTVTDVNAVKAGVNLVS